MKNYLSLTIILSSPATARHTAARPKTFILPSAPLPNTLCHIALQAPASRLFCHDREFYWVIIACILPDLPWVILRILLFFQITDPFIARLYTSTQASLFFCLLLSAALAAISRLPARTFIILSLNCLCHLLLDATQIKWGNGVHLFLPINWSTLQWHIFWPEHPFGIAITIFGFVSFLRIWHLILTQKPSAPFVPTAFKTLVPLCCLSLYIAGPYLLLQDLEKSNYFYIKTLREKEHRPGKPIEFDRIPFSHSKRTITTFSGEKIRLTGNFPEQSGIFSLQGSFISASTVQVNRWHEHSRMRDWASILGLFMACTLTIQTLILSRFPFTRSFRGQTS